MQGSIRKAYDVWFSDENDRSCGGVIAIDYVPEYHESDDELAYRALDVS